MSDQNHPQIVFRQSNRVILRPLAREDLPYIVQWINDPEVTQFLTACLPITKDDEDEWFDNVRKNKSNNIVLAVVVDDKIIGTMGIHRISWKNRTATTGACIGYKPYWGKGYGTEAKMLLLDYAFNTLNLRKICSEVIAFNERSYRYNCKCGYKEEGRRKAQHFQDGEYWDEILLAVFKEDWLPLWEAFVAEQKRASS